VEVRDPVRPLFEVPVVVVPAMAGAAGVSELSLRAGTALTIAAIVGSVTLLRGPSPLVVAGGLVVGGLLGLLVGTLVAALMRLGSIAGAAESAARSIPAMRRAMLSVTGHQLSMTERMASRSSPARVWTVGRGQVAGIERRPRLQQLARFRLHFSDGSWIAIMTPEAGDVRALTQLLGRHPRSG